MQKINIKNIYNGFKNFLFKKKKPVYKERYRICKECEHRKGYFCGICGCFLKAKVSVDYPMVKGKSIGGCPMNKW